jgi:hypothetical protein
MKTYADLQTENIEKHGQGLDWNFETESNNPIVKLTKEQLTNFIEKTDIKSIAYYINKGSETFVAHTNKAGVILTINNTSNKQVIFRVTLLTCLIFIDLE